MKLDWFSKKQFSYLDFAGFLLLGTILNAVANHVPIIGTVLSVTGVCVLILMGIHLITRKPKSAILYAEDLSYKWTCPENQCNFDFATDNRRGYDAVVNSHIDGHLGKIDG